MSECDDFGDPKGTRFFDQRLPAVKQIARWKPRAVGDRPIDWGVNDLLLGGMSRDPRNWFFREASRRGADPFAAEGHTVRGDTSAQLPRARAFLFFTISRSSVSRGPRPHATNSFSEISGRAARFSTSFNGVTVSVFGPAKRVMCVRSARPDTRCKFTRPG